jgi:hypothetical protein
VNQQQWVRIALACEKAARIRAGDVDKFDLHAKIPLET